LPLLLFFSTNRRPPGSPLFPYTTLFRSKELSEAIGLAASVAPAKSPRPVLQNLLLDAHDGVLEVTGTDLDVAIRVRISRVDVQTDRKSTRLNSSHSQISYAVFCLKKKNK